MEKSGDVLVFFLNGEKVEVERPDPAQSLADYLRGEGFTGTKVGCGRGLCGACTVMLSTHDPHTKQVPRLVPVYFCIFFCFYSFVLRGHV
jgi:xanthine dehydrogenase/oxidase